MSEKKAIRPRSRRRSERSVGHRAAHRAHGSAAAASLAARRHARLRRRSWRSVDAISGSARRAAAAGAGCRAARRRGAARPAGLRRAESARRSRQDARLLRVGLRAAFGRLVRYLLRSPGPPQPGFRDHPGRRAGVERERRRHGLDLHPRPGADVERWQPGHRQRLGRDVPLRRGPGSRLGLHLVSSRESSRGGTRRSPARSRSKSSACGRAQTSTS